jgi:hypothetical protein
MKIRGYLRMILLVAAMIALVSCSNPPENKIVGKWQGSQASLKASGSLPLNASTWREGVNAHKHTIYTFNRDKTFTLVTEYKTISRNTSGTWTMSKDGTELTLVMPDYSLNNKVKLMEISDHKLTWIMNYPFGELSTTFVRVK